MSAEAPGAGTRPAAPGRYEFRCWPGPPPAAIGEVRNTWHQDEGEVRSDFYLLSPLSMQRVVKLRSGRRLEIKTLAGHEGPLEYWTVPLAAAFPLGEAELRFLSASLALTEPLSGFARLTPLHLLADIAESGVPVRIITAQKFRTLFRRGSCRIEISRIRLRHGHHYSVALEDPDPRSALNVLDELGLSPFNNLHIGAFLSPQPLITSHEPLSARA